MQYSILLLSSSSVLGYNFLEYNSDVVKEFVAGISTPVLFVPYAADTSEWNSYTGKVQWFFAKLGVKVVGIHTIPVGQVADYQVVFVGGGNTFRLLSKLQDDGLLGVIKAAVSSGTMKYMGASAGSNMAGKTICTTNDMPIVYPKDGFEALGFFPYQINPHYIDPDPATTHKGETRDQRIAEYHQVSAIPVIGLREGAYLGITPTKEYYIGGQPGAKVFERGKAPYEVPGGQRLSL